MGNYPITRSALALMWFKVLCSFFLVAPDAVFAARLNTDVIADNGGGHDSSLHDIARGLLSPRNTDEDDNNEQEVALGDPGKSKEGKNKEGKNKEGKNKEGKNKEGK